MYKLLLVIGMAILTTGSMGKMPNPSASDILKRTEHAYASCRSYRDTGTVSGISKSGSHTYRSTLRFQTAFTRPDRFRFEYNISEDSFMGPTRQVVWTSGGKAYSWWTIDSKVRKEDSLDMAIAGATGVSSTSAHIVPRLLMPGKITGWEVTDLKNSRLLKPESIGGANCFKIEGSDNKGGTVTLWIGKSDYLIRKITHRFTKPAIEFTTVYQPKFNTIIPASSFNSGVKQ